jgi:hypothetical protein
MSQQYKIKGTDGNEYGPVSTEELHQWIAQNRCTRETLVQVDESGEWVPMVNLPDFQSAFSAPTPPASSPKEDGGVSTMIPYKNTSALIAYYLGVFCILCPPILSIPALVLGIKGLHNVRENPEAKGTVHAWIGIVSGSFFLILSIAVGLWILFNN